MSAAMELVENARRGADHLRPLVDHLPSNHDTIVMEVGGARFEVSGDVMKGVMDVLDAVVTNTSNSSEEVSEEELTPQQAAGILRMSRPSVMRLVEKGILSVRLVGSHHRLVRAEVLDYKKSNRTARREALQNLADLTEEYQF
jgi:excisionase family DNA binding protein